MGVLKNDVGRPSNKTIMVRRILKGLVLIIVIALAVLVGYYVGDKNDKSSNKKTTKKDVEKEVNITTNKQEEIKEFDKTKITTVKNKDDEVIIYVYDKKIDIGASVFEVGNIETIQDIAIIELLTAPDSVLIIVNTDGDILYNTMSNNSGLYCTDKTSECNRFEVSNDKIYYYLENLGHDVYNVCEPFYNKEVLAKYEISYENGKLSEPKKVSSLMTGKEYIEKHNVDCSQ